MTDTSRIPQNPADWTFEHAQSAVAAPKPVKGIGDGLLYLVGEHFQEGEPWIGPQGDKEEIRSRFVSVPESARCIATRVNGSCGNEADISMEPRNPAGKDAEGNAVASEGQQAEAQDWRADFGWWWTAKNLWGGRDVAHPTGVRGMVAYASAHPSGSATVRAFYNPASRTLKREDGTKEIPRQPDRRTALRHINVVAPPPDRCAVYTDPDTHAIVGVFLYTDLQDRQAAEVWYAVEEGGKTRTALRQVVSGVAEQAQPKTFPWGGILPIQQANIGCLLTPPVRKLQAALDFGATALHRNQEFHGWALRTEFNSEEDGSWRAEPPPGIAEPRKQTIAGTVHYFWPEDPTLSVRTIRRQVGFPFQSGFDAEGRETFGFTTPSVHYHDPSDPEAILKGMRADLGMIRDACHQGHITDSLFGSTAEASGDAYEQRRADFEQDIKGVAETVDNTLAPFATVVTLMADYITGDDNPTFADEWEVKVQSHPSAGPVSTERQTTTLALLQGGVISPEEATARVGVQDVQAERDRIARGRTVKERAEVAKTLIDSTADPVAAWVAAGFDEEQANKFARTDGAPFVRQ